MELRLGAVQRVFIVFVFVCVTKMQYRSNQQGLGTRVPQTFGRQYNMVAIMDCLGVSR